MSQTPPIGQPAYVLHCRAYRENSALVDFLTPQGRLRAVLRSARGKAGTLARPFVPLEVEFRGRGELKNVGRMESAGVSTWLNGEALFSGLYLNELLIRLLPAEDPASRRLRSLRRDLARAGRRSSAGAVVALLRMAAAGRSRVTASP